MHLSDIGDRTRRKTPHGSIAYERNGAASRCRSNRPALGMIRRRWQARACHCRGRDGPEGSRSGASPGRADDPGCVSFLPPLSSPGKIICVINYAPQAPKALISSRTTRRSSPGFSSSSDTARRSYVRMSSNRSTMKRACRCHRRGGRHIPQSSPRPCRRISISNDGRAGLSVPHAAMDHRQEFRRHRSFGPASSRPTSFRPVPAA